MDPSKSVSSDIQYQGHESLQKLEGKDTSGRTFVVKTRVDEITGQEIKTIKALNKWQKIWASLTSCFGSKYEALTASDFKNLREGVLKTGLNDNTRILGAIVLKQQLNDLREEKLQGNSAEEIVKNYSKAVIQTILDNVPKGSHADQLANMSLFKEMKNEEKIITLIKLGVNFDTGLGDEVLGKRIAMGMWSQQDLNDLLPTDQKKMPSDKAQVSSPKSTGANDPASSLKKNSQPEKHPQKDLDSSIPIAEVEAVPKEPEVQAEPMPQHDSSTYHRKVPEVKKYAKGDLDPSIPKRDKQKKLGKGNVSDAVYEQKGNPDLAIKIVNRWGEYVIGAALDHPVLAKTHQLYAREHPDLPSLNKYKMVMEKVKGQEITKCNIPNDQVVTLMEDAKDCCLYLFRAEVCWEDINFGNVFVEDTGHLKLIDFGSWHLGGDSPEDVARLLVGAMELTGWIIGNSTLVKEERKEDQLLRKIQLPEKFFGEQIDRQIFSDGIGMDILRAYDEESWMQEMQKKVSAMSDRKQKEAFISEYFDSVIALFKGHQTPKT